MTIDKIIEKTIAIALMYPDLTVSDIENSFLKKSNLNNEIIIYFDSEMQYKLYGCARNINNLQRYTDHELSLLIKGIVIGEVYMCRGSLWGAGSVTATFAVPYALEFRNKPLADKTRKWVQSFGYSNEMYGAYEWNGGEENYKKQIQ